MRSSIWTPSIVPSEAWDYCLVIDDLGDLGRVFREAVVESATFETVVTDLLDGQYSNPIQVVSFNADEGWSHDVSADVAAELRRRCDLQLGQVPSGIQDFNRPAALASFRIADSQLSPDILSRRSPLTSTAIIVLSDITGGSLWRRVDLRPNPKIGSSLRPSCATVSLA
jgi:hypothetical protein